VLLACVDLCRCSSPLFFLGDAHSDFLESLGGENNQGMFSGGPGMPVNTTEKFFLTAANPSDGSNEDRLTQVINAKFEAGFLKPYNYVNGYSRLQKYMDSKYVTCSLEQPGWVPLLSYIFDL